MAVSPDIFIGGPDLVQRLKNRHAEFAETLAVTKKVGDLLRTVHIGQWDTEEIAIFANNVQRKALREGVSGDCIQPREVDPQLVGEFLDTLKGDGGRVIMMRHGGQKIDTQLAGIPSNLQKIRMMQPPFNLFDPTTEQSLAESIGSGVPLRAAQEITGKTVEIRTSENARSLEVAILIAQVATASYFLVDRRLNCVNYQSYLSLEALNELLGPQNNGSLVWQPGIVDAVCGERGIYQKITSDVFRIIEDGVGSGKIVVCVTHTQQTNAADLHAGEELTRYAELGMRIFQSDDLHDSILLKDGIYKPQ